MEIVRPCSRANSICVLSDSRHDLTRASIDVLFSCNVITIFARQVGDFYRGVVDVFTRADTNKLLLNPSFAGLNKNTNVHTGLFFMSESKENLNNDYYFTYDTFSEKLKGGVGFYFYQGLNGSRNINTAGLGFTYSKILATGSAKSFIPSFNLNYKIAAKHWFAQAFRLLSPTGTELFRYSIVLPRAGFLWDSPNRQFGLSIAYSIHIDHIEISEEEEPPQKNFPEIIFYFSELIGGKQKGLASKPYELAPEVVVLYSGNTFLTRAGLQVKSVKYNYGLFLQNNYSSNIHGAGGVFGWNFSRFKLNLATGSAFHFSTEKIAFFGEISLALKLPYTHFDQKKPWATPKKFF